jgi:hypothetical protein
MRQRRASGLSVRDYCSLHQVRESTFHFWQREIARRDQEQQRHGVAAVAMSKQEASFVPVTLIGARPDNDAVIDIRLPSGHRLRVRRGCDRRLLGEVVAVLEGRPC